MIADLIWIEQNFGENHVLKRQMPSPDGSKLADSIIAEYYKQTIAETIPLTGFNEKIKRHQELKEEQPEIYEKYKKSVLSRRFTVKAA